MKDKPTWLKNLVPLDADFRPALNWTIFILERTVNHDGIADRPTSLLASRATIGVPASG